MENQKFIVCVNRAGIGNRLRGLVSAIRLCKLLKRKLLLYWENNQYCGCNFNDLFENKFDEVTKEELKKIKNKNSKIYKDVLEEGYEQYDYLIFDTWKFVFLPEEIQNDFNKAYISKEGSNVNFEFQRIPEDKKKEIINHLSELIPVESIRKIVENFSEENNLSNCIGLHIRRADYDFTVEDRGKVSSDRRFIEKIQSMPNEKFLLCTDGVKTENNLKELFKDRIIVYPKGDRKRSKKESLQEALIDMLLLSKTKNIFGSYLSTFTELAWWFGGCKNKMEIVGIENVGESLVPRTFLQKVIWKLKFYKVNFLRWIFRMYK